MPEFAVIIPAAGRSTRFGGQTGKLFMPLAGQPVLARTLAVFARRPDVTQIVIAATDQRAVHQCIDLLPDAVRSKARICGGGDSRAASVAAAARLVSEQIDWVAVHDAARPLVSDEVISRVLAAALSHGAAAAALAVGLTVKQADGPLPAPVRRTVPRHDLWTMQTPQVMRRTDLLAALAACPIPLADVTDDVQLLELCGKPVWLVEGDPGNIKITTPVDLKIAEALLESGRRT
jgi:2-C-methyl-D-erythritol 4-phosphate cytidylyltransferase